MKDTRIALIVLAIVAIVDCDILPVIAKELSGNSLYPYITIIVVQG